MKVMLRVEPEHNFQMKFCFLIIPQNVLLITEEKSASVRRFYPCMSPNSDAKSP